MIIIYDGEIYHTNTSEDIIEHHGIKGMKWGQRLRGNYVVGSDTANRAQKKILRLQKRNKRSTPAKEAWKKSIAKSRDRADEWRHKVGGKKTTTEEVMGYYNASRYDMKAKKLARKGGD